MSGGLNKVLVIGNVGKDPEIKQTNSGAAVATFSIAVNKSWRDKTTGEKCDHTEWIRVVVFNENLVGVIEKYVHKGSKLYVEGEYKTRKWTDKGGVDHYSTEVVMSAFGSKVGAARQVRWVRSAGAERGGLWIYLDAATGVDGEGRPQRRNSILRKADVMLKMEHIERSDSLRIIHYKDRKEADAFVRFMESVEAGTAVVRVPGEGRVVGAGVEVGAVAVYKAIAGDVYDCIVVCVRGIGASGKVALIDVDVIIPGVSEPMRLTKVRFDLEGAR